MTKYTLENKETGEISYLDEFNDSEISTENIADSVEAVRRVHKDVDTVGTCDESYAHFEHHKGKISVDFKQKVNDLGFTTAAAILATAASSLGTSALLLITGAVLALVSDTSNVSMVFEETDFANTIWTYCYITDGWREYDTDEMTLFSKEENGHYVPPSL